MKEGKKQSLIKKPSVKNKDTKISTQKAKSKKMILTNIFRLISYAALVAGAIIISQFIIGYTFIFIIGKHILESPFWLTIYSTVTYIFAAFIIIFKQIDNRICGTSYIMLFYRYNRGIVLHNTQIW